MVHFDRMLFVWWVATMLSAGARAFLYGRTNCQVSEWIPWSTEYGFGQVSRERTILRHPANNGTECPHLLEMRTTGHRVSILSTAKSLALNFVSLDFAYSAQPAPEPTALLRDLLIIMDGSGSIGATNFTIAKNQLARLLGMMCPEPDPFKSDPIKTFYQQAAMITFSDNVREIFDFNDKVDTSNVKQAIKGAPYQGGMTCTGDAFDYARTQMFTSAKGMRSSTRVKQEVLILSDGRSNCGRDAVAAATLLESTANVYGLMMGKHTEAGMLELTQYVSSPKNEHLFALEDWQELEPLVGLVEQQLQSLLCAPFDIEPFDN